MNDSLDKIKEHIDNVVYNKKNLFSSNYDLDKIIEDEFKKAIENLHKCDIIKYIKNNYKIKYTEPKLKILENKPSITGEYLRSKNEVIISKKSVEEEIDNELKFLDYKEIKGSISDIQDIKYLYKSYKTILLYPLYINGKTIKNSIAEFIIRLTMFHEIWHSIDYNILRKLSKNSTIKDRDYLLTILNNHENLELRASAFQVVMYYLTNDLYKDEKGYVTASFNIPTCRKYIEEIDKLENDNYKNKYFVAYDLGSCYGNIIVAKYRSSLEKNIYKIIDDIIHLDRERAIEVIKYYGDNPDKLLND
jgi:hypothetical protein